MTTFNTIVLLPWPFNVINNDNNPSYASDETKSFQSQWFSKFIQLGNETVKNVRTYAPPSLQSARITPKCISNPLFLASSIVPKLEYDSLYKLKGKHLKILVPAHGSPIGIGPEEFGRFQISPEVFATDVYNLILKQRILFEIHSLAIRFLSCNSGTPLLGTKSFSHSSTPSQIVFFEELNSTIPETKKTKETEIDTNNYLTSFAGRFALELIRIIKSEDDELLNKIRISVSGVVGYYVHFTKARVLVYDGSNSSHITLEDSLVQFTKEENKNFLTIDCPKRVLHIKPDWLFEKE